MAPVSSLTATTTAAALHTYHRLLHGTQESNAESTGVDQVFWAVNGFIFALLISVCSWFWCCGGIERMTSATADSDQHYRRQVLRRRQQREEAQQMTPEQRKQKILQSIQRNQVKMVVQETDLVEDSQSFSHEDHPIQNASESEEVQVDCAKVEDDENDLSDPELGYDCASESNHGYLQLRHASCSGGRQVPNCCAICLGSYQVDEAVVWSSNPDCLHAFHEDCLVDWLVHSQQQGTPCPVCRQAFTDLQNFRKERKIRWEAGNTMDLGAVSLR